jgi:hypothetical protein
MLINKNQPTPRAPDKCGALPALAGKAAPTADSASGGFFRQIPPLPVTPAVGLHLTYIMKMPKYIFLDNWVYSLLTDTENERRLSAFLKHQGYTILVTALSFVELYNPNWEQAGEKDRMNRTANFLGKNPSVIIHAENVRKAETKAYPNPVSSLPISLDLYNISAEFRTTALLSFLRGETIVQWAENYKGEKAAWFINAENIIEHACQDGYLKRNAKGEFIELEQQKELFLLSLDYRSVDINDIDSFLAKLKESKDNQKPLRLTSIRLSSLCFWYSYIYVDQANKMKHNESDIGDFEHISLLPYCSAFTTDGSMARMLNRIVEPIVPTNCRVITRKKLDEILSKY